MKTKLILLFAGALMLWCITSCTSQDEAAWAKQCDTFLQQTAPATTAAMKGGAQ